MLHIFDLINFLKGWSVSLILSTAACAAGLSYLFILIVYRLYFHPLATIPGPILACVTDWYNVIVAWGDDRHLEFYKLHEHYGELLAPYGGEHEAYYQGPIVRYGPSRVSINTISGLDVAFGMRSNVQKSQFYGVFSHYFDVPCTLSVLTNKEHTPKRKIVSQAFSESAIQAMEEHILRNVRTFCDQVRPSKTQQNSWSTPLNLARWTNYLTFDIMSTLCFSISYDMLTSEKQRWITSVPSSAMQGLNVAGHMQWIVRAGLDKLIFSKLVAANDRFQALSSKLALKRYSMKGDVKVKDAFYFLQNAQDPVTGVRLTKEQLIAEAGLMIGAGADTTSVAMSSTMFYLLRKPECLLKLQQEIRPKFTDVEQISAGPTLTSCTYLRACIEEALRMTPGVSGILPREVLHGGISINGYFIPAGMDVGVPIYAIHHNEKYFPDPFLFIPERWLPDTNSPKTSLRHPESVALARSAFCAFSLGAWGCLGKTLAYKEIMITIARLVWLFDWQIAPGTSLGEGDPSRSSKTMRHRRDEFQGKDYFAMVVDGPIIQFRDRGEAANKF